MNYGELSNLLGYRCVTKKFCAFSMDNFLFAIKASKTMQRETEIL